MSVAGAHAASGRGLFSVVAAAGAGGDDGEKRPPAGPLGKRSRSAHEEDTEAAVDLSWQRKSYACASCRLTFYDARKVRVHMGPRPADELYIFWVILGRRKIYLVDDGLTTRPPEPLPGRVVHVPELNPPEAERAIQRYFPNGFFQDN